jgi:uncharacterized cupredoxin-like copper-binding protein
VKLRIATVSAVTAALVVGGAAASFAATPAAKAAPKASLTLTASATHVKAGQTVTFTGRATGLKNGSKVTLQEKDHGKWVSLPATATVKKNTYKLTDKFKAKGTETLRVVDGKTASRTVTVTVR